MRFRLFALDRCRLEKARNHVTRPRPVGPVAACSASIAVATLLFAFGSVRQAAAQDTAGPYSNLNRTKDRGPIYYNPGYAQNGLPGVGVSPWNPIVGAQVDLGVRTARYNMYRAWADEANAAANLAYQRAVGQAIQNQQQAMQARIDVRQRVPRRDSPGRRSAWLLPPNALLKEDGSVAWPASAPSGGSLDQSKSAAEAAIRIAVKEYASAGKATIHSVAEAQSQLVLYGKPALEELARANRGDAETLLTFLASLEQVLNELAGGA